MNGFEASQLDYAEKKMNQAYAKFAAETNKKAANVLYKNFTELKSQYESVQFRAFTK
jgi:hypothetical protein